eukprot:TRINITY_DN3127_c0_g1_i1.p2 TRINITY_DN3127_c0_g1~~TRINITY_DN3127_c0_g1_i1.p2  ORF type:complete len:62 (+),score=1.26 TRINITY_DN3127_c0_g1_i1:65-250(+)
MEQRIETMEKKLKESKDQNQNLLKQVGDLHKKLEILRSKRVPKATDRIDALVSPTYLSKVM